MRPSPQRAAQRGNVVRERRGAELGGRDLAGNVTVFHQLFMGSFPNDFSVLQNENLLRIHDCTDSLRNDQHRRVRGQFVQRLSKRCVRFVIQR